MSGSAAGHKWLRVTGFVRALQACRVQPLNRNEQGFTTELWKNEGNLTLSLCCNKGIEQKHRDGVKCDLETKNASQSLWPNKNND